MRPIGSPGIGAGHSVTAGHGVGMNVDVGTGGVGPIVPVAIGVQVGEGNGVKVGRGETGVDRGDVTKWGAQAANPTMRANTTTRKKSSLLILTSLSLSSRYPYRTARIGILRHLLCLTCRYLHQPDVRHTASVGAER